MFIRRFGAKRILKIRLSWWKNERSWILSKDNSEITATLETMPVGGKEHLLDQCGDARSSMTVWLAIFLTETCCCCSNILLLPSRRLKPSESSVALAQDFSSQAWAFHPIMHSSKNSELHNSNQKLVLHMWEDENNHHESQEMSRKHHKHHHRNRHKHHSSHKESEDRIDVYVAKRNLKGPPTKPKPNMVELARKSHSLHSKNSFPTFTVSHTERP